jgi:hypothetical protein
MWLLWAYALLCFYTDSNVSITMGNIARNFYRNLQHPRHVILDVFICFKMRPGLGQGSLQQHTERSHESKINVAELRFFPWPKIDWLVCRKAQCHYAVTWSSVTIGGFWIDIRIYWALRNSAWLYFIFHSRTYTHTSVHSHIFTSRFSVANRRLLTFWPISVSEILSSLTGDHFQVATNFGTQGTLLEVSFPLKHMSCSCNSHAE